MKTAAIACMLMLAGIITADAKPDCRTIPYHAATNDEGGYTLDPTRHSESIWVDNANVRRYGGSVIKLCDGRLWVPR